MRSVRDDPRGNGRGENPRIRGRAIRKAVVVLTQRRLSYAVALTYRAQQKAPDDAGAFKLLN